MGFADWLKLKARSWVLGPASVNPFEEAWGHDTSQFVDPDYGNYIATSSIVYSVVTLRANLLADLPIKLYTGEGDDKTDVMRGTIFEILRKVNPYWTARRMLKMTSYSLDLWGQAFWFCERGESGMRPPAEVWWGRPDHVAVVLDEAEYLKEFLYYPDGMRGGQPMRFMPSEVVWFRNPNPVDQFAPLSPLASARMAADLHNGALQSNDKLFRQGLQIGGFIMPPTGTTWTPEQTRQAEEEVSKRHGGVEKAHRWAFFRQQYQVTPSGTTPRDAEFVQTLNLTLEEVARVYGVPLDLLGGQRTYANVEASERGVYQRAIIPLANDISSELNEQFIPMFGASGAYVEFDTSHVTALQEAESEKWQRDQGKLVEGAITINEWRKDQGLDPVPWGDLPKWVQTQSFSSGMGEAEPEEEAQEEEQPPEQAERQMRRDVRTPFGSDAHRAIWQRMMTRGAKHEKKIATVTADLFKRQQEAVLAGMKRSTRDAESPFNLAEWKRKFREAIRPVFTAIVAEVGQDAIDELNLILIFNVKNPAVRRFIERRAQRFAEQINETTWEGLRSALGVALEEGKGLLEQMRIVEEYMAGRIRSSSEVIARTEAMGALNGGTLEGWRQSDVVTGKEWIATLDDRVRDGHADLHSEVVGLNDNFTMVLESGEIVEGPAPGQMGAGEADINCRCTIAPVVEYE